TLLPNGAPLMLGGEDGGRVLDQARVSDPATGDVLLHSRLRHARAWQTATVLPDGNVAVIGGVGRSGQLVRTPELFDLVSERFTMLAARLAPRAAHTAT